MRRVLSAGIVLPVLAFGILVSVAPVFAQAQTTPPAAAAAQQAAAPLNPAMPRPDIIAFAKIQIKIDSMRDSLQYEYPQVGNKKPESQASIQERMNKGVEEILHHNGLTKADYQKKIFMVSSDNDSRKIYDSVVVALTGLALPGAVRADAGGGRGGRGGAAVAPVPVPAGPVGTHIGHVMNSFTDTPGMAGLLRVAAAEAAVAATHAGLGARTPDDLAMLKLHAGHVLHALDPTTVTLTAPGQGYGVKKAATGVAAHIELAAGVDGASANVKTHSAHVALFARNTVKRVDQIIALAKQVQEATTAAQASPLFNQMVPLTQQLMAGFDANGDGRIGMEEGEGGLQQAEEHVTLLLRGESSSS